MDDLLKMEQTTLALSLIRASSIFRSTLPSQAILRNLAEKGKALKDGWMYLLCRPPVRIRYTDGNLGNFQICHPFPVFPPPQKSLSL